MRKIRSSDVETPQHVVHRLHCITYALPSPAQEKPVLLHLFCRWPKLTEITPFRLLRQRIRTEMSHCNPAHLSIAPLPLLTASSSPGSQPFSFGMILAGFHHQIYTLDWPFLPSVHPHTTSTSSTVNN